jgi:hypothetical protein
MFQFPSLYHGEKMWKILFSELVHKAVVQGRFRLVFLRKSENRDKKIFQYTIGCARYKVYMGKTRKRFPMLPTISKGKTLAQIGSMRMVLEKRQLKGGKYERRSLDGRKLPRRRYAMLHVAKEERCPFRMTIYFKKKDGSFNLDRAVSTNDTPRKKCEN